MIRPTCATCAHWTKALAPIPRTDYALRPAFGRCAERDGEYTREYDVYPCHVPRDEVKA